MKATIAATAALSFATVLLRINMADLSSVSFTGGHDIGPNDFGRPCNLIAAAIGVRTEVFREAFSGVTPARGHGPTGDEARRNKEALMKVLGPRGVTNDRLDEVSNFYRYRPQSTELWRHREAKAHAVEENGTVKKVVVTDPGFGYSSPPKAQVKGLDGIELVVKLHVDRDLKKNGSIETIEVKAAK
jgi:hypothetical protein